MVNRLLNTMQRSSHPLSERTSSQENSQGDKSKNRVKSQHGKPTRRPPIESIVISDEGSGSDHELGLRAASIQDSDDDDFAVLSEPLPLFEHTDYSTASDVCGSVFRADWASADMDEHSCSSSVHILNHFSDDSDSDGGDEQDASGDMTQDECAEEHQIRGVPVELAPMASTDSKDEPQDEDNAVDDETDLNVLRFRGHLAAFASSSSKPNFRRAESGVCAAATKMPPPPRPGLTKKTLSVPVAEAVEVQSPPTLPSKRETPAKAIGKGKASARASEKASVTSETGISVQQDPEVNIGDVGTKPVKKSRRTPAKTKPTKAKSTKDAAGSSRNGASGPGPSDSTEKDSISKRKRSPVKRRPRTPPPDPVDLSNLPAAHLLIMTSCPLCGESFPKHKSSTVRRRHIGICTARQGLTADSVVALVSEEVARLDKAERASRAQEEELKTTWQLVVETSRMDVREVEEEELWDALGVPWESNRRKASAAAKGALRLGEPSAVKRRRLVGATGCLLLPPAQSRKEAARGLTAMLDLPLERRRVSNVKSEDPVTPESHPRGIDFSTGDVVEDVSEPAFAFPMDQRLAEVKFLSTQLPSIQAMATQAQTHFPCDVHLNPDVLTTLPPCTQTFTQAPSTMFRARSASRLWKRRKAVPGVGTGLGFEASPLAGVSR